MKYRTLLSALLACAACATPQGGHFDSDFARAPDRVWLGPEYWANPLQDWQVTDARIECVGSGGDRNVALLTHELAERAGAFQCSVMVGRSSENSGKKGEGWVGFRIGSRGDFADYRDSAVRGRGLPVGFALDGRLFVGDMDLAVDPALLGVEGLRLDLRCDPIPEGGLLTLRLMDAAGAELGTVVRNVHADWLQGLIVLVCSRAPAIDDPDPAAPRPAKLASPGHGRGGDVRFWFADWSVSGDKLDVFPERAWGPILFAQHTLHRNILSLTAQLTPIGAVSVRLEVPESGGWRTVETVPVDPLSRSATFRIPEWNDERDTPYRLACDWSGGEATFEGTIRRNPKDAAEVVVAAFTGNNDFGFPHQDIVDNVSHFEPDFLVYTGDQLYEGTGGYGVQRRPLAKAALDYLHHWYLFGWEYRELLRDTPSVCLPDDHDVYHGNIWGQGGKKAVGQGAKGQDTGGYKMPAEWVNLVQRTQTSHHPPAHDPTPVEQGIGVYYGPLNYGGISFAVIEDRKWKSAPGPLIPQAEIWNGWAKSASYDAITDGDAPAAVLLGERQLDFLEEWSADWSEDAWMKVVLSQTIFANVATLPEAEVSDANTPRLRVSAPGEYPEGEKHVADHDSNGWPQTGRDAAVRAIRKGFAFHIAGDQHLGSTIQYGLDEWNDSSFALCVPSVANVWPRRWFPPQPGAGRKVGDPRYNGEFLDGFGNKMTVHAVSNPTANEIEPTWINHRAPGYGIVVFERATRRITCANWPRWVDASAPGAEPYPGWPIVIEQQANYARTPFGYLPTLDIHGADSPVVRVSDDATGELLYALRIPGRTFRPKVFAEGSYTVSIEGGKNRTFRGLTPLPGDRQRVLQVILD
jgi:alkaline phosphatase D